MSISGVPFAPKHSGRWVSQKHFELCLRNPKAETAFRELSKNIFEHNERNVKERVVYLIKTENGFEGFHGKRSDAIRWFRTSDNHLIDASESHEWREVIPLYGTNCYLLCPTTANTNSFHAEIQQAGSNPRRRCWSESDFFSYAADKKFTDIAYASSSLYKKKGWDAEAWKRAASTYIKSQELCLNASCGLKHLLDHRIQYTHSTYRDDPYICKKGLQCEDIGDPIHDKKFAHLRDGQKLIRPQDGRDKLNMMVALNTVSLSRVKRKYVLPETEVHNTIPSTDEGDDVETIRMDSSVSEGEPTTERETPIADQNIISPERSKPEEPAAGNKLNTSTIPKNLIYEPQYESTEIIVKNCDTIDAAVLELQTIDDEKVVALNFANATSPGGGYRRGRVAQEEEIFRRTNLAVALDKWAATEMPVNPPRYPFREDEIALSRFVTVLRKGPKYGYELFQTPKFINFLSVAAFDANEEEWLLAEDGTFTEEGKLRTMRKISSIFSICAKEGFEVLILGAFGCGAFKNPPKEVAAMFVECLSEFPKGLFKKVVFAILDSSSTSNCSVFSEAFHIKPAAVVKRQIPTSLYFKRRRVDDELQFLSEDDKISFEYSSNDVLEECKINTFRIEVTTSEDT